MEFNSLKSAKKAHVKYLELNRWKVLKDSKCSVFQSILTIYKFNSLQVLKEGKYLVFGVKQLNGSEEEKC